jgi:hypothetical protein
MIDKECRIEIGHEMPFASDNSEVIDKECRIEIGHEMPFASDNSEVNDIRP